MFSASSPPIGALQRSAVFGLFRCSGQEVHARTTTGTGIAWKGPGKGSMSGVFTKTIDSPKYPHMWQGGKGPKTHTKQKYPQICRVFRVFIILGRVMMVVVHIPRIWVPGVQIAPSRSCLCTSGRKLGIILILTAPGFGCVGG